MSKLIVENINLIDGSGADVQENVTVVIEDGKFTHIGSAVDKDGTEFIDGQGKYMLPGMIDTHVHLSTEFKPLADRVATPFSYHFYEAVQYAERTINAGVTTVRDALGSSLGFKQAINDGIIKGPRMQVSINALSITGGHGDGYNYSGIDLGLVRSYEGMPDGIADGVEEVRKKTRELLRAGADVIKVMATGGVSSPTDHPQFTQYSLDELKVIVEEAQFRNGVKVMAHAQGLEGIKNCVEAGIHSIEHGIYLDDEVIEKMKEKGTYLVPTLLAPVSVIEFADELGISAVGLEKSREVMEDHKASFKKAYDSGVKIAMGTDAGVFKHGTNLRELELMVESGATPMDAIVISTKNAAECMEIENLGLVKKDYIADFILTDKNPLEDIGILKNNDEIKVVAKDGEIFKNIL